MSPISSETRAHIVADYQAGMTQHAVATKHDVGAATVHRIIKAAGAERGRKFTTDALNEAIQDYLDSGESIRTVARRHPMSEDTLRDELRRRELTRPTGWTIPTTTKTAALDDFINGMTIAAISEKHGISRSTVTSWLDREGLSADDREDNGDSGSPWVYEGGWQLVGGVRRPLKPTRKKAA